MTYEEFLKPNKIRTITTPIEDLPESEREHFRKCFICSGWIDMRDLAHVYTEDENEGGE
jgi:hypothetical protein